MHLRKCIFVPRGLRPPRSGPFKHFIQLPLSMSYQYALVTVYMSSGWVEVFPYRKADSLTVAKKLLENVFPI